VRCHPDRRAVSATVGHAPFFVVFGRDHSVFLETIKRGDLDSPNGPRTIVLRLYEAYDGHACVWLQVNVPGVTAVCATNLLEDDAGAEALALEQTTGEWGEEPGNRWRRRRAAPTTGSVTIAVTTMTPQPRRLTTMTDDDSGDDNIDNNGDDNNNNNGDDDDNDQDR